jgi:hypothetical protein
VNNADSKGIEKKIVRMIIWYGYGSAASRVKEL